MIKTNRPPNFYISTRLQNLFFVFFVPISHIPTRHLIYEKLIETTAQTLKAFNSLPIKILLINVTSPKSYEIFIYE